MRFTQLAALGGGCLALSALVVLAGAQNTSWEQTQGRSSGLSEELVESGGGGNSGCSGCACCFPRTPEGLVRLDGLQRLPGVEQMLYMVPHHEWLILTDLEALAMDATGTERRDVRLMLVQEDMMGMRSQVRWANCSVYHSARGLAIPPGSTLLLVVDDPTQMPESTYWQLNGYLWPSSEGH